MKGSVCGTPPPQSRGWDTALRLALTLGVLAVDGGCTCRCTRTELSQRVWDAPPTPACPVAPGGLGEGLWLPQLLLGGWG